VQDITVRQMDFRFPERIDPIVIPDDPEQSYLTIGLSLLLPYLEPYLIRTMKAAKKQISDPDLVADLEKFSAQEGQHYRQHIQFNDAIRGFGFPGLEMLEAELDADYRSFSATRPLEWNLAYAEGFEALTTAVALFSFDMGLDERAHPAYRDLMSWHLAEELEHRTVAFDVYQHVHGRYLYRLRWGLWAQRHMTRWIGRAARHMMANDPRIESEFGGRAGLAARRKVPAKLARRHLLPRVLKTYLPWYTPHNIPMTEAMKALAARYTEMAVRTH
jgi:predicted metal-dependent hydrolase